MNKEKILKALYWLWVNNYHAEVFEFYEILDRINRYALNIGFSKEPELWTSGLMRKVKKLLVIDKIYYDEMGDHFLRLVNTKDKEDMLDFVSEINAICRI